MKHTVQTLTPDVLVEMFGDSKDWYSVLKNGKRVGTFSDLRAKVLKMQALADKKEREKLHANLLKEDYIREANLFFTRELKTAEVFMNRTQPNVHINGCKCYIICGTGGKIRLGILHKELSFDDMQQLAGIKGRPSKAAKHILFDNISLEEGRDLIKLLCS